MYIMSRVHGTLNHILSCYVGTLQPKRGLRYIQRWIDCWVVLFKCIKCLIAYRVQNIKVVFHVDTVALVFLVEIKQRCNCIHWRSHGRNLGGSNFLVKGVTRNLFRGVFSHPIPFIIFIFFPPVFPFPFP